MPVLPPVKREMKVVDKASQALASLLNDAKSRSFYAKLLWQITRLKDLSGKTTAIRSI
jgi:hypothetical protein